MTYDQVKEWVVKTASVTNPSKRYWSASVTLGGMDINGNGYTIEKAYKELTKYILGSTYYAPMLEKILYP
jgi:hypothetical protein